jgi:hypothetical protein
VPELCREHGMSTATFYKRRSRYGGMAASMMSRLKELEDENRHLKRRLNPTTIWPLPLSDTNFWIDSRPSRWIAKGFST